ncbi:hypothetical protein PAXINDRAFT_17905 [Paxillus involutus ATCC 200175]|uniref:Uncharacterized protein n=1 Tax=Paxillus involutus ATCC 200175 TaxID=664439 RepID=A0A0C9TP64_PAXIN|nr:hypothetical protein PAXINDRAFT_17905 [Paxillus involutus ATCC 200175]
MAELRRRTEHEKTSATLVSTRPATSTTNAVEGTQCEQIEHRSAHDNAVEVERLRTEAQRLRTEAERLHIKAQEKEAAASRMHELLILDRQIELARIHARSPAPGAMDPRQG